MQISLLDRSRIRSGSTDAQAIGHTVERAIRAEQLGFRRFWTAEHHAVPGIATSAPTVLLAAIGARTSRIRLGTGGVMAPNHQPLVIAEQALLLESLYPGRIDLGLGGSLGFTPAVRRALGRMEISREAYRAEIEQLRDFLDGQAEVTARPRTAPPPMFMLAIKGGLQLATELGLPVVVGGPLLADRDALQGYRDDYRPSAAAPLPYLMVSTDVAVADTAQRARDLVLPEAWAQANSRMVGEFRPLRPVDEVGPLIAAITRERTREQVEDVVASTVHGTADQVAESLQTLVERTGADELLASVSLFDLDDMRRTDEFLAGLQP